MGHVQMTVGPSWTTSLSHRNQLTKNPGLPLPFASYLWGIKLFHVTCHVSVLSPWVRASGLTLGTCIGEVFTVLLWDWYWDTVTLLHIWLLCVSCYEYSAASLHMGLCFIRPVHTYVLAFCLHQHPTFWGGDLPRAGYQQPLLNPALIWQQQQGMATH